MPKNFRTIHMHAADAAPAASGGPLGVAPAGAARREPRARFTNDEAAARYHLHQMLDRQEDPTLRELTAPSRPEVVPDLRLLDVRPAPGQQRPPRRGAATGPLGIAPAAAAGERRAPPTPTTLVRFEQTHASIPVFGSRATVELDGDRKVVSIYASVGEIPRGLSAIAKLGPSDAVALAVKAADAAPDRLAGVRPPTLTFYNDEDADRWHLAWFVADVPKRGVPDGPAEGGPHGLGRSPRDLFPVFNYLVDAHEGTILLAYPAHAMVTLCRGLDVDGVRQRFYAEQNGGGTFEMFDKPRSIRTFDLQGGDLSGPFPSAAITSPAADPWNGPAAISAHVNAMRVQEFLFSVLARNSVDDNGMELVSVVNCTYGQHEPPPQWHNAVWWNGRMWYGQALDGGGQMRSYSRHLDVIAHELTHGVTEHTAGLVYLHLSGALNESVSDIFGMIVQNWVAQGADSDVSGWTWELGPGLGSAGGPLRDMANPRNTGDPDHMSQYVKLPGDEHHDMGGVHKYSNIHNRAAYLLLTATEADGSRAMAARDVAVLYYLALKRLGSTANFSDMRDAMVETARSYFGDPAERTRMVAHIEKAYDGVGIT